MNKMTLQNLAIVFTPSIIFSENETLSTALSKLLILFKKMLISKQGDSKLVNTFFVSIITDPEYFFGPEEDIKKAIHSSEMSEEDSPIQVLDSSPPATV